MWIISTIGFFSAVQKPGDDFLTVRARARGDLERLRARYLPELGPVVEGRGTDYRFRARVGHEPFAAAVQRMAADIDYPNFKSAVAAVAGHARARIYGGVWHALLGLERH